MTMIVHRTQVWIYITLTSERAIINTIASTLVIVPKSMTLDVLIAMRSRMDKILKNIQERLEEQSITGSTLSRLIYVFIGAVEKQQTRSFWNTTNSIHSEQSGGVDIAFPIDLDYYVE